MTKRKSAAAHIKEIGDEKYWRAYDQFPGRRRLIVEAVAIWIIAFALLGFLYSVTVEPMMRNYKECGTIFLCANQKAKP